jgi:hypothetical protein
VDLIQEITVGAQYPLHVYYANKSRSRIVGYVRAGTKTLQRFSKPLDFDVRGRRFQVLKADVEPDSRYFTATDQGTALKAGPETQEVQGSGGRVYILTRQSGRWTCNCPGATFRGQCRHAQAANEVKPAQPWN